METKNIKFALMADAHFEIMHDGKTRMQSFLEAARQNDVDFIIHLGDFCYPTDTHTCYCPVEKMPVNVKNAYDKPRSEAYTELLEMYNSFEKPAYHVLGNHEFDFASVDQIVSICKMPSNYYSFHKNGWHFIVLDGNYIKTPDGKFEHYDHSHYFWKDLPWLPPEELEWLKNELSKGSEPVVIFSHQPLFKYSACIKNYSEFAEVINAAKQKGKDVRICINGHLHVDDLADLGGILYYNMNSLSNMWVDEAFETQRFSTDVEEKYPNVRYTIPYKQAVYSIVTLTDDGISVQGVAGEYISPGPAELGYKGKISPTATSWHKSWKR